MKTAPLLAASLLALLASGGCQSEQTEAPPVAPPESPALRESAAAPAGVPAGWSEYTDWSAACPLYVPASREALPAPIRWTPCPAAPAGVSCRVMAADWTSSPQSIAINPRMAGDPRGAMQIAFTRAAPDASPPWQMQVVADVDGPVRAAVLAVSPPGEVESDPGCYLNVAGLGRDGFALRVAGEDARGRSSESKLEGLIGARFDELRPVVLSRTSDGRRSRWSAGDHGLSSLDTGGSVRLVPWDRGAESLVLAPGKAPEGMTPGEPLVAGDAVFLPLFDKDRVEVHVWDPARGLRPFLRGAPGEHRLSGRLGTDGVDLVWTSFDGAPGEDGAAHRASVMTAPFTTDPAALRPRRVRSDDLPSVVSSDWVVGCGWAAHGAPGGRTRLVRLSDGRAYWVGGAQAFRPEKPIGLSCEELFTVGVIGDRVAISAIQLGSLGPGTPAD